MPIVYRVEHKKTGVGPYKARNLKPFCFTEYPDVLERHSASVNPCAVEDNFPKEWFKLPVEEKEEYYYAFNSIEQLFTWFTVEEELETLHNHGFIIRQYDSDDMFCGESQIVFRKSTSTKIKYKIKRLYDKERIQQADGCSIG